MVRRVTPLVFAAATAILLSAPDCPAQNRTTGGTSGFGTSSFGASGFGGSSFGGSSFGSSAFGGSSFGQSAFGQSGFGGLGNTGSFGQFGSSGSNAAGGSTFVGRGGATTFVGRGAGQQQLNVTAGQQRSDRAGGSRDSGSSETRRPEVRVRLTASPELMTSISRPRLSQQSVSRLQRRRGLEGVAVSTAEGVTVLEGTVATDSQRLLAEKLLAIEPGVGRIENRLRLPVDAAEILPVPR